MLNFSSLSMAEIYASSMKTQIDLKKNEFSYSHADISEWREYSIVSENKLFNREEGFLSRRILLCLANICEQFPQFSSMLFIRSCVTDDQPKSFLELLSLTIKNFSHYVTFYFDNWWRMKMLNFFIFAEKCSESWRFHWKFLPSVDSPYRKLWC